MKRVKLKVSVANFDGYTYSPGDVMEMSDEDAEYIIATGQGTETTDQVTDVAAREAAEGEHAIQVDIQHGDAPEIVIVADDGDKTRPVSEGGDDPDPAPADDAGGDTADTADAGAAADTASADAAQEADAGDQGADAAADAGDTTDSGDAAAADTADTAPVEQSDDTAAAADETAAADEAPKKRGRGRPRKNS